LNDILCSLFIVSHPEIPNLSATKHGQYNGSLSTGKAYQIKLGENWSAYMMNIFPIGITFADSNKADGAAGKFVLPPKTS